MIRADFQKKVDEYTAAGPDSVNKLPNSVIEFYNTYIADDDSTPEKDGAATAAPASGSKGSDKKKKKTTDSAPVSGSKKKEKKEKSAKSGTRGGDGIVALAVKAYFNKKLTTTKEIVAEIQGNFPDRNITSTVSTVTCVMQHVKEYI